MKKRIKVVGAIIQNENNEVLCALRSPNMSIPNMWEFPGGKVEEGEELSEAVVREIKEELNCDVECLDVFNDNTHEYDNFIVNLITIKCRIIKGTPISSEHSKLIWLRKDCLESLVWAPADIPAVRQLVNE
ncbi:(deoxy)nucleoside triphosphate pyrophosphohydrolase [Clostridium sp. SYSU_GA19001]|uniref:(deoxy)nucleoside triphosphate pyrophosphohydrolase n=1 Tax=Clostridium caldaquaticum TaxID=2940653 RepID=UPI0020770FD2|nr:(deoxy)nucleoside triphosphate pyrophosphohydrolase [Clostridium caldaquaticum]MCM8710279.1 (deoxy)nucleoside triphosphate pyrophosphohydrolase [Clostridium caldaquaticum]